MKTITLYHGTTDASAAKMIIDGWQPNSWTSGGQCGNPAYLYLTNSAENALWYSQEKDSSIVLEITVTVDDLLVDPEDGTSETVEDELSFHNGFPGSVVLTKKISADRFKLYELSPSLKS